MAITAKGRAALALRAITELKPAEVLGLVAGESGRTRGSTGSLLTSGLINVGAQVTVERRKPGQLDLSLSSGKRLVELCTFSARVTHNNGQTRLQVGGLESYKTSQSKLFYLIPTGPKRILGYDRYRNYLHAVSDAIYENDPGAELWFDDGTGK